MQSFVRTSVKSVHSLCALFLYIPMNISRKLYIFERMVVPIVLYGSEVYAIGIISDLKKDKIL